MKTKMIVLPLWGEKILRVFSFVVILVLDTTALILTPIAWMQLGAHMTALVSAFVVGGYWYIAGVPNAALKALSCFVAFVLTVAFIKLLRKYLNRVARRLDKFIIGLLPVCIYVKVPAIFLKTKK